MMTEHSSEIFCFICGEEILMSNFLSHYEDCKKQTKPEQSLPETFCELITRLSMKEVVNIEDMVDTYNYQAKKLYGGCNRKSTMASSEFSEGEKSINKESPRNEIELIMEKIRNENSPSVKFRDYTTNKKKVRSVLKSLKQITNEEILTFSNLNIDTKC